MLKYKFYSDCSFSLSSSLASSLVVYKNKYHSSEVPVLSMGASPCQTATPDFVTMISPEAQLAEFASITF